MNGYNVVTLLLRRIRETVNLSLPCRIVTHRSRSRLAPMLVKLKLTLNDIALHDKSSQSYEASLAV